MRRSKEGGAGGGRGGLLPNSLRIISSCLKTVSANAGSVASTVRSASASVAATIAAPADNEKDQVLWAGFDKLELGSSSFKRVLLLGYSNGYQVLDVEDASNVSELVSKRDGPVTFLQMQPIPANSVGNDGFKASHPMLLVVAGDETNGLGMVQGGRLSALIRESANDAQPGSCTFTPTVVRFFSLKSHSYVHVLRFRSAVYMVRCSPRIVAIALAAQIYCFDAMTLENKFSVLTYPLQGAVGLNIGYGPMAIGPRWLAYAPNNPLLSNIGRLSPQNLTPSQGVSPSTSPGNGSLVARYALESSKQLAAGIINLGDMGYRTLSKYYQELLPDGSSSPLSTCSSRKVGNFPPSAHLSEADNAGMVVIKDFVTKEIISQFRAHTSPISALCFDPSGTLLVTASIHGHNINVFRIMPSLTSNGSSPVHYDWAASHVHLYKLYRGLTTAVIQDICFSPYSQWIAIVSSHGTCHIFALSPFGGEVNLLSRSPNCDGSALIPCPTLPWWSTSSCMRNQQFFPPPPPVTLSVVSRIKNGNSRWLSAVSNVAASTAGKVLVPLGAIAAVFHNLLCHNGLPAQPKANSLEHLLIYSPSGHLVQHELLPSLSAEMYNSSSRTLTGPSMQLQDEELHVNAEPVQWWDVCRRSNWPEREENISRMTSDKVQNTDAVMDTSGYEDSCTSFSTSSMHGTSCKECISTHDKPHWYLSNAEVQINSERWPIWQNYKISFYMMAQSSAIGGSDWHFSDGEFEIEKLPIHEVEIKRKDLLPVFEQFHSIQPDCNGRVLTGGKSQSSCSEPAGPRDGRLAKDTSNTGLRPSFVASNWLCDPSNLHPGSVQGSSLMSPCGIENVAVCSISGIAEMSDVDSPMDISVINCSSDSGNCLTSVAIPTIKEDFSSNNSASSVITDASILNSTAEQTEATDSLNSVEFTQYFHEGYCKVSELDDCCHEIAEVVTDVESSSCSHCEQEKPDEDVENDDMLGVFTFCE